MAVSVFLSTGDADTRMELHIKDVVGHEAVVAAYYNAVPKLIAFAEKEFDGYKVCIFNGALAGMLLGGNSETAVVAMLALTFPDLRWHINRATADIGSREEPSENDRGRVRYLHELAFDDIFDGLGRRSALKSEIKEFRDAYGYGERVRERVAVSLDEEEEYAYYHAYVAYRFGFGAIPIVRFHEATRLLSGPPGPGKGDQVERAADGGFWTEALTLTIEDAYLRFADQPESIRKLWDLEQRDRILPGLRAESQGQRPATRHFVTSGQHAESKQRFPDQNKGYFDRLRSMGVQCKVHYKPSRGMFGLLRSIPSLQNNSSEKKKSSASGDDTVSGDKSHSAQGRILLVARTLTQRASRLLTNRADVKTLLRAATFATEAFEMLGYLTPTVSIEALRLKHEAEVRAECAFIGVRYHIEVAARAGEIEADVRRLARSFSKRKRGEFVAHALVSVMSRLAAAFRESGRFEEEQACLVRMRSAHRRLIGTPVDKPLRMVTGAILWYTEVLLSSFTLFVLAIGGWLSTSSVAWWFLDGSWKSAVSGVSSAFFSGTAAGPESSWALICLSCLVVAGGFLHLGVLVAYIYTLITRR